MLARMQVNKFHSLASEVLTPEGLAKELVLFRSFNS